MSRYLSGRSLDVKTIYVKIVATVAEQDHIDRFLEHFGERLPVMDLVVEGIVDRIGGLNRRLHREMDETLEGFGLNSGEWKVLGVLWRAGAPHRASPGTLAKYEELSTGAMTNRLDRLEEAGFVRRLPDPDDRRAVHVELTSKGKRTWEKAVAAQSQKEAVFASALTDREKQQLTNLLRKLMLGYEKREKARLAPA
jgi:DNA-binding MarR family transcriptional regulator